MVIAALLLNLLILAPLIVSLTTGSTGMDAAFGSDTTARRILTCVYLAIALISAALLIAHASAQPWALLATLALFAVQITYKIATVALVGLTSPVVMTNLFVVAVQLAAILSLVWRP